jgi:hypothetical protein
MNLRAVSTSTMPNTLRGVPKLPGVQKITRCWCDCNERLRPIIINTINSEHALTWECTKCNHTIFSEQFKASESIIKNFDFLSKRPEYEDHLKECLMEGYK